MSSISFLWISNQLSDLEYSDLNENSDLNYQLWCISTIQRGRSDILSKGSGWKWKEKALNFFGTFGLNTTTQNPSINWTVSLASKLWWKYWSRTISLIFGLRFDKISNSFRRNPQPRATQFICKYCILSRRGFLWVKQIPAAYQTTYFLISCIFVQIWPWHQKVVKLLNFIVGNIEPAQRRELRE